MCCRLAEECIHKFGKSYIVELPNKSSQYYWIIPQHFESPSIDRFILS
jgi:hypothetical protein